MNDKPLKLNDILDKEDYLEITTPRTEGTDYFYLAVQQEHWTGGVTRSEVRLTRGQARLLGHWLLEAIDE